MIESEYPVGSKSGYWIVVKFLLEVSITGVVALW